LKNGSFFDEGLEDKGCHRITSRALLTIDKIPDELWISTSHEILWNNLYDDLEIKIPALGGQKNFYQMI